MYSPLSFITNIPKFGVCVTLRRVGICGGGA